MQMVMGYILRHEDYFRTVMEQQMKLESAEKILILSVDYRRVQADLSVFIYQ